MTLGPVMVALTGLELLPEERDLLRHPLVGGVTLFSRNYHSPEQVIELTQKIHKLRNPSLIIAVDQEGGRVQRFREAFTRLPPGNFFGEAYDRNPQAGLTLTENIAWLMAVEVLSVGVDISFAPVLDLNMGISSVIGDRAFHCQPEAVADLTSAFMRGMHRAGMAATGKHFPGHGGIAADSHLALCVDNRDCETLLAEDLAPYRRLIPEGLDAVMVAHVLYPNADAQLAGFSAFWLRQILRDELKFEGVIFSDDLEMEGANPIGGVNERAQAAVNAGCDVVLVCHKFDAMCSVIDNLKFTPPPLFAERLARLPARNKVAREQLRKDPEWLRAVESLRRGASF